MDRKQIEVRSTLYAFISAIEIDLKSIIRSKIVQNFKNDLFINDINLRDRVKKRFMKDKPGLKVENNICELVDYLDFQDTYKVILSNKKCVTDEIFQEIKNIIPDLDLIAPVRNRIMHNRPLMPGDFVQVYSFIETLKPTSPLKWSSCVDTKARIEEDSSYALDLKTPYTMEDENYVYHNLPMPDFDETGFIGRAKDAADLTKLLTGPHRVVSIIGDGGIGKTALMLKVSYDLIDMGQSCPFDMVIWTTAKTDTLTLNGIKEIKNALRDYSSVIEDIAGGVGAPSGDIEANLKEILEYMETFKILLIIDNLETILDSRILEFIREASFRCKIAITSRIGLGELEYRRSLEGLSEIESASFIRAIGDIRNSQTLKSLSNGQLAKISKQLHYNPLALRWFVNSVAAGKSPDEVLSTKDDLLGYCLDNVCDKLGPLPKLVLSTMLAARKKLSDAELIFLAELKPVEVRRALNSLLLTTLIERDLVSKSDLSQCVYGVSDFARGYLLKRNPPNKDFVEEISRRKNKLTGAFEETKRRSIANEFDVTALTIRNSSERVVARYLQEALRLSKRREYKDAIKKIEEARQITPGYFEVYRVSGFVKSCLGVDLIGAEEDYKMALSFESENFRVLYFYAGFLLQYLNDPSLALTFAEKVLVLKADSDYPIILYSRCLGYSGDFKKATHVLEKLLASNGKLSAKVNKIASTLAIDFYRRWADDAVKIDKDYKNAISCLHKGIEVFKKAVSNGVVDHKLIQEFSQLFCEYMYVIAHEKDPALEKEIRNTMEEYRIYLEQGMYTKDVYNKFYGGYGRVDTDKIRKIVKDDDRHEGFVVQLHKHENYAFIDHGHEEKIYLNKKALIDQEKWNLLQKGHKVYFSIGQNKGRPYARNVDIG